MLLGDAHLECRSSIGNTRLKFEQGIAQSAFVSHLYGLFCAFIQTPPQIRITIDKRNGKEYQSLQVRTLSYVCFNFFHELFYVKSESGRFTTIVLFTIR